MAQDVARDARILIVDDEPANVLLMQRLLEEAGYRHLACTTEASRVLTLYREFAPDLVLLDLLMPGLDGIAVLQQLRAEIPPHVYLPVLVLTADVTPEAKRRALAAGARDFLTKPFERVEALLRIGNLLDTRRLYLALEEQKRSLEMTVRLRTEQLLQSEKVATMGSLLAGVAHELNNPLSVVSGQAQLLQSSDADPAIVKRAVKIAEAADRCVRIVRNFLALARQQPPERGHTLLRQVVSDSVELLSYQLRAHDIQVVVELDDHLPVLWADAHQLHQVLVNLLTNAYHALRRAPGQRRVTVRGRVDASGRGVRLEVADTGPGVPPDIAPRIFEPFFTTKAAGEGTGLGLSLCRSIVEEHGGTISVTSAPGPGATFVVELPVVAPPPMIRPARGTEGLPPVGRRRILIVDDEVALADVVAEAIERDGHTVDRARDGAVALDMLARTAYDAVLSDTRMPVLDGERFYAELCRRHPAMARRVIFLTGDVLSRDKREFLEGTGAPFLTKPFDLDDVRRVLHRLLAGVPEPAAET